jgi:hypothetical protein
VSAARHFLWGRATQRPHADISDADVVRFSKYVVIVNTTAPADYAIRPIAFQLNSLDDLPPLEEIEAVRDQDLTSDALSGGSVLGDQPDEEGEGLAYGVDDEAEVGGGERGAGQA